MKIISGILGLVAAAALLVGTAAYAEQSSSRQSDAGMQSSQSQQMSQQEALTKDPQMVKQVQQALSDKGYYKGAADGKWGSKTKSALKKYQKEQGMKPTGQLDQQTMASLGISGSAAGGQQESMPEQQSGAGGQQGSMPEQQGGSKY